MPRTLERSEPGGTPTATGGLAKREAGEASFEAYNTFAALLKYTTTVDANWQVVQRATSDQAIGTRDGRLVLTYKELRALADEADLLRLAIEDVKGIIKAEDWEIDVEEGVTLNPKAEAFVENPDLESGWDIWTAMLIEELAVTDRACLFPWWKGGRIERLEPIDGTSIRLKPDPETYRLPDPPVICYEQDTSGKVLGFTKATLWLMPVNRRVGTLRGFSPTEQVIKRASVNISKVGKDIARWLKGGVPAGLLGSPDGMALEGDNGLKAYQKWIDNYMRRPGAEHMLQVVAGNPRFSPVPALKIDKEHEEILSRVICKAIGSDPTSLVSDVNRASADALAKWASLRGVYPYLWFLKGVIDKALPLAGFPGHRLRWKAHRNAEEAQRLAAEQAEYESGLRSWEETRQARGLEIEKKDLKDKHFVIIGKSMQAFDPLEPPGPKPVPPGLAPFAGPGAPMMDEDGNPITPEPGKGAPQPPPAPGKGEEGRAAKAACSCGGLHQEGGGRDFYAASFRSEAERADLKRWETIARKAFKAGQEPKAFKSEAIRPWKLHLVQKSLCTDGLGLSVFQKGGMRKASLALGSGIGFTVSPRAKAHHENGKGVWSAVLGPIIRAVVDQAMKAAKDTGRLTKSYFDEGDVPPPSVDSWKALVKWLEEAYQIGVDDTAKLFGHGVFDSFAYEYAQKRGADLLGRWWNAETGAWVDNPNSVWSIEGTLRDRANAVVTEAVANEWTEGSLQEALSQMFEIGHPEGRSAMIAQTEMGFAYNRGAASNYAAVGVEYVLIVDGGNAGSCSACEEANGQVWTVEKFLANPLEHPYCSRVGLPADESEYKQEAA